jgi:hypothetical protein
MVTPIEAGPVATYIDRDADVVERGPVRSGLSAGVGAMRRGGRITAGVARDVGRDVVRVGVPLTVAGVRAGRMAGRAVAARVGVDDVPGPEDLARMATAAVVGRARRATTAGAGGWGSGWSRFAKYRTAWEA